MPRLVGPLLAATLLFALTAPAAPSALFFLFDPTNARAGEIATVRLGGTPPGFGNADRERPFRPALRVYLVARGAAAEVGGRFDPRLSFLGRIVPDRRVRGLLRFTVPPLDTGDYVLAYWCPGCARFGGATFGVQTVPQVSRYRLRMGLRVDLPAATADRCPATVARDSKGRYGNGLLQTTLGRDGRLRALRRDGVLFQKLAWLPLAGLRGTLVVRGERLDAPGRMRVLGVYWGHASRGPAAQGSWASAVTFPSAGCYRITGRVGDVALSYVASVVG
ncbi:MAG TPA: hypothetical protein VNJ53_10090 [Gaiellaceae bacterium]|nr:hypothetical protein [Gaiellaceae bacterium]